ncbi:MAG TPA: nitrate reductase associated protein [Myxococcales bacterium]|nr:nitrate reductase associated protein [Myxococcales bacterium]
MYLRLRLEGDVHETLEFIPLAVRRKLDLAGLKLSLAAWTALTRAERLAVCHLPVDGAGDLDAYREALAGFAQRAGHPVAPLEGGPLDRGAWGPERIPQAIAARAAKLSIAQWSALPEEARYVLLKLSEARRSPEKFEAALRELKLS